MTDVITLFSFWRNVQIQDIKTVYKWFGGVVMGKPVFKTLKSTTIETSNQRKFKVYLSENQSNKNLYLGIREYVETSRYTGFTENGVSIRIDCLEDLDTIQDTLYMFLEHIKENV